MNKILGTFIIIIIIITTGFIRSRNRKEKERKKLMRGEKRLFSCNPGFTMKKPDISKEEKGRTSFSDPRRLLTKN